MAEKVYHYPLWVRLWHLINALLCLALIISGISMQFTGPGRPLINFGLAVSMHNFAAVVLTINYLFFILTNRFTGNGKFYKFPLKNYLPNLSIQFRYYMRGIFRGATPPFPINESRKFNPLQHFAYVTVMYILLPAVIITGWAMLFPEIIMNRIFGLGGLFLTDLIHIIIGFMITMFLLIHIYFCMLGTKISSSFRSIINGWADIH